MVQLVKNSNCGAAASEANSFLHCQIQKKCLLKIDIRERN